MEPMVSVIIPVYNAAPYLRQCLDSVLQQSLSDFEVICVEDGSWDTSLEILKEYQRLDQRVHCYVQKHQYAGPARNKGMEMAKGKYFVFLDADDYYHKDALLLAVEKAEETQAALVVFREIYVDGQTGEEEEAFGELNRALLPEQECFYALDIPKYIFNFTSPAPRNKLFRASLIRKAGIWFPALERAEDSYFICAALAEAEKIAVLDAALHYYRTNNPASLEGRNDEKPECFYISLQLLRERLISKKLYGALEQSFLNLCISSCWYLFRSLHTAAAAAKIYTLLKETIIPDFALQEKGQMYYYDRNQYFWMQRLMESRAMDSFLLGEIHLLNASMLQLHRVDQEQSRAIQALQEENERKDRFLARKKWLFPYHKVRRGSRILLYGAGDVGRDFYQQATASGYCTIAAWVDKDDAVVKQSELLSPVKSIRYCTYDAIVIAIYRKRVVQEVVAALASMGIPQESCILPELEK